MTPSVSVSTGFYCSSIFQMLSIFFRSLILRSYYLSSEKGKENCCLMSMSSIKREIGKFHVGVVQRGQGNEQSCCFADLFCRSRCRRRRLCLSSLTSSLSPLKKVLWTLWSPRGYFRKFSLSAGVQNSGNVFQSNVCFLFYLCRGFGTLGTRGFFSRATGSFVSSAEGRRHKRLSREKNLFARVTFEGLTETGNRAWKACGTQGRDLAAVYILRYCDRKMIEESTRVSFWNKCSRKW